jgi:capsular exopolysaccharide synthesis family protein
MMQLRDASWTEPAEGEGARSGRLDVFQLLRIFRQYKWLILGITVLGTLAAAYLGAQRTPTYTATASMMIEPRQNQVVDMEAVVAALAADEYTVATQTKLLLSREHIELVMASMDLFHDPEFSPSPGSERSGPLPVVLDGLISQAVAWLPETAQRQVTPTRHDASGPVSPKDAAIERFADRLDVRQEGKSYVISVQFTSPDPIKAAAIANRTAALFVENARESKLAATSQASAWLGERVSALREEVTQAERAIEDFRVQNGLYSTRAGADLDLSELEALNNELVRLRTEIASRRATLGLIEQKRAAGQSLDEVAEVGSSPAIQRLRQDESALLRREAELSATLGPRHPSMVMLAFEKEKIKAKIDQELGHIVQALTDGQALMESRQQAIQDEIAGLRTKGARQSQLEIQLRELEREAQATRELHDTFLQRFKETREQQALVQSDVHIVSRALPPNAPASPGPKVFGAVGFTVSFMGSALLALLVARRDRALRDAVQIKHAFGLDTICTVPALRLRRGKMPHQYMLAKPLSAYAEAMRSAYLALREELDIEAEAPSRAGRTVLITSSLPGEGKSTFALSLATLIAQQRHKVLIIDLDLRHPSVHRGVSVVPAAGIIEYCADEALAWQDIVQEDPPTKLHAIVSHGPKAPVCPNPVALMESERLRALFQTLRQEFDVIVIDSPPLLGVIEARMATAFADAAIFAVGWGKVDAETAQEALHYLRRAELPVVGATLTQVNLDKQARYYDARLAKHRRKFDRYYVN